MRDRQVMNIQSVQGKMVTYAEVDKSAIFPKHILQYESGNAETKTGFGNHRMSGVSPCAVGRQLRVSPSSKLKRRSKHDTSCYKGFGFKALLSDDDIFKLLL
jgi:hypothetical protein